MEITIDGISEAFESISEEKQQQAIAKARELLEKEAQQYQSNEEWQKKWKASLRKIKGMWKDRDMSEFETIRKEFTRNLGVDQ